MPGVSAIAQALRAVLPEDLLVIASPGSAGGGPRLVVLRLVAEEEAVELRPELGHRTAVLRTRDGKPVSESSRLFTPSDAGPIALSWEETAEDRWRLVGVDPEDGLVHPVVDVPCGGRLPAATTKTTLVWICTTMTGAELMWQEWGAATADRLPLTGWPPLWDQSADYYQVDVLPAPGFLALVRYGDEVVTGYPG